MTDPVSEKEQNPAVEAQAGLPSEAPAEVDAAVAEAAPAADAVPTAERGPRNPRGRRGGAKRPRGGAPAPAEGRSRPVQGAAAAGQPARQPKVHPVLEQLASLYPALFGEVFLPLKRGIFQDLLEAHPELFERETLKEALALHTRSSRYLTAMASGQQRHDLQAQPVEALAPEHVHHALIEVFRRRQQRQAEDLRPKLRNRIIQAFEASGLTPEAYASLVQSRDEAANAVLHEALSEATARAARDEAQLRAFESSGQTLEAFADMYGLDPREAARTVERARRRRAA